MAPDLLSVDYSQNPHLLELESQILTQYQLLAVKLNTLSDEIRKLNVVNHQTLEEGETDGAATQLAQNLRGLESKIGLVYTLFRGAVYTLFLQGQQNDVKDDENAEESAFLEDNYQSDKEEGEHDVANQTFVSP